MADGITKDDLRDILIEVRREDMGHNNYYNVPPGGEVTKAINNPLVWISGYTVLLGFLGVLIYAIYTSDKDTQNGRIEGNTALIKEVQEGQEKAQEAQDKTNQVIVKMQGNQERIAKQIEKNGQTLDDMKKDAADIKTTRFTDKEGGDLKDDLEDEIEDLREELLKEVSDIQNNERSIENELDALIDSMNLLKGQVQRNKDQLDDRSLFIEDTKDRIKALEMTKGN